MSEGVFIGVNGISTDLERSVWHQVMAGRPSHMAGRMERPPQTFSTDSSFSSSCRRVTTKARAELPQTLPGRPLCPLSLGSGPLGSRVKYTPVVMMILIFYQQHFVIPSNAPIWYLNSWNQINTKITELG
jgi:hypothetical protein